ncbi:TIR domain-containing protein [Peribacillus deserti]|uniref:Nucleotide-binding-like protein n=1 Tax=Peribacillus deserti TaxID=673318 RepID=A0A2N5M561_9BACI|nr:TIR domain-containing protein [Peribacillus deserti]PLT29472.1 nucleotide-binding-like protein [Peribacillus deserti]
MEENKPCVFIGSSREAMDYVNAVQKALEYYAEVNPWYAGVFSPGNYTMDDLEKQLHQNDFAVFICSPDDIIDIRGKTFLITRDNTLFEMGLFWGRLKRSRVFYLIPNTVPKTRDDMNIQDYHLLSDLIGLNPLKYQAGSKNYDAAVSVSCQHIIKKIQELKFYQDPEILLHEVRRKQRERDEVALFTIKLTKELLKSDNENIYDYLSDALRSVYAILPSFKMDGVGVWKKEGIDGLKHAAGKAGDINFYSFNVNNDKEDNDPDRILMIDSFLQGEELVHLTKDHLFKTYLICYPIGVELVITVTISGPDVLTDEQLDSHFVANYDLIKTINYLFGGASK